MADQSPNPTDDTSRAQRVRAMRSRLRAVRVWSQFSLFWESLAPAILPFSIIAALFLTASWLGLFRNVPDIWRILLGCLFVFSAVGSLYFLRNIRWPRAHEVDARLERDNHLSHQPITAQDDQLAIGDDAFAHTLWNLHQRKLAGQVDDVRGVSVRTTIPQLDPYALRSLVPLALVSAFAFSLGASGGSMLDVLRSHANSGAVAARIDAWITPPYYTGVAPIFLTSAINAPRNEYTVPEGSKIVVRISGGGGGETVLYPDAQSSVPLSEEVAAQRGARQFEVAARIAGDLSVSAGGSTHKWHIGLIEDQAPEIAFDGKISRAANGTMSIPYIASDDFGLARANAYVKLAEGVNSATHPLYEAPEIKLSLPRRNSEGKAKTAIDLTEHPWAGARVKMVLEAEDDLEQIGHSKEIEVELPGRPFSNPLARALIEQRRNLALDANNARAVYGMLDLFLLYPEETIDNTAHFLGIVTALSRLKYARNDDDLRDVVDYLWQVARHIEDGGLSEAERRLKNAQQALAEALESGASDQEIEQLMSELRDAMKEFMSEFARQNQNSPNTQNTQNAQQIDPKTLDELMDRLEALAKSGAHEQAKEMLSQLQDMMNNLQMGQHGQQQGDRQNQAQQQMNELGKLLRDQQELMNKTFKRNQRGDQGDESQGSEHGQQNGEDTGDKNQQGQQPGASGDQGQEGGERSGKQGKNPQGAQEGQNLGSGGTGQGKGTGQGGVEGLASGQQALQDRLNQFKEGLKGMGISPSEAFEDAGRAMDGAGEALGKGLGDRALNEQSNAMEALRRGAQKMMEQMQQANQGPNGGNQAGGTQNTKGRDPLGRPQGSSGPDFGGSVKVPDEIDVRRAREILDAIRKRLGKGKLEQFEKDYLERLLDLN